MDERKKYLCCEACEKSTREVPKVADFDGTGVLIYYPNPNTKISRTDGTETAGDNEANGVFDTENLNNIKMGAAYIAPDINKYKVSCPRCRYILRRSQKSMQQIPIVKGLFWNNICDHCKAQISHQYPLIKEQCICSKLKSEGILLWRKKDKELFRDTKITKSKHKDLSSSIKIRERRSLLPKIDPSIRPLLSLLKSDEESLSGIPSPVKRVSIRDTVEIIQESEYGSRGLDKTFNFKFPRHESLSEGIIGDMIRSSTELFKDTQFRLQMQAEEKKKKIEELKNNKLEEKEKKRQAHINKKEQAEVQKKSEEHIYKKKREKRQPDFEQETLSKKVPGRKMQAPGIEEIKSYKEKALPAHKKGLQANGKEQEGKPDKEKTLPAPGKGLQTSRKEKEEKPDKDQLLPVSRKDREEKLAKAKDEKPYKKELLPGPEKGSQAPGKQRERQLDKNKLLPAPRKEKAQQSDKEKPLPAHKKELQGQGKEKEGKPDESQVLAVSRKVKEEKLGEAKDEKPYKKEVLPGPGKGLQVPTKNKSQQSDKDKSLPAPEKGLQGYGKEKERKPDKEKSLPRKGSQAAGKEKEEQSDIDQILPVSTKKREEKLSEAKDEKLIKKEVLPAPGKGVQATEKDKEEKSDKEKALLVPGKKEVKSNKEKGFDQVPRKVKDEKSGVEREIKLEGVKIKDNDAAAYDAVLGGKVNKIKDKESRSKGGEEGKETIKSKELLDKKKQKFEESNEVEKNLSDNEKPKMVQPKPVTKDLVDKNKIKVTKPEDNVLLDLILQFENGKIRHEVPATIIIPPHPIMPKRNEKINVESDSFDTELERELAERAENSSNDELVYINKIVRKHEIPRAASETKERAADIVYNNIFNDDLRQRTGAMPENQMVKNGKIKSKSESPGKGVLSKVPSQDGVFRYALSDRTFIDKGWTLLPIEKVVRKTNVYRMRPAHPEFNWFEHNKVKGAVYYDSGEKLAEFKDNGLGQWFYRNGRLALDYYDAKDMNAQQRIVIYSNGDPDERGRSRPITVLGMFDYLGNGVIFDHKGKVRLKYNQTEGVLLDQEIGPASHWKWHSLNDPPVLQQVMIDTQMYHKDPKIAQLGTGLDISPRVNNKDMVAIEFENAIKEKTQKVNEKFSPYQIKMKALKINENFSLRVLDQASIYLLFRDGTTNLKLNLGMLLDSQEIVDTDTADLGEISTGLERLPPETESLEMLQRNIKYAQQFERNRIERECRLRHPEPAASADRINALVSRPLKPPLTEVNYVTAISGEYGRCYTRKPSICTLYYNNRLN